jgi:hypothetical protein
MSAPKIGDVLDGYMFIGGNPADQNAWRAQTAPEPMTIQEQHPDLTWKDRLVIKNLSTSPESAMKYLQKEHPNLEIEYNDSGAIRVKRKDEKDYRVLDPDTGISDIGELAKDIGDVGYDVLSGIGTGVATAAGGLAGAVGGGIGALPGAALAGASASGGLEAARQGFGSAFGLEDNMDTGQILGSTAAGAVSPLLFGTGATAANVGGKGLAARLARGLGKELPEAGTDAAKAMLRSQRGLPAVATGKVIDKYAPRLGGFLSGTPTQTVTDLSDNIDDVAKYELDSTALKDFVEENSKKNLDIVSQASGKKYQQLAKHIESKVGSGTIDVTEAAQPMFDKINELSLAHRDFPSGDTKAALEDAIKAYEDVWGPLKLLAQKDGPPLLKPITIKPAQLKQITTSIQDVANFGDRFAFGTVKPKTSDAIELMGTNSYKGLQSAVEKAAEGSGQLRQDLAKILQDKADMYKNFTPNKVLQNAENFGSSKTQAKAWADRAKAFEKMYGTNFNKLRGTVAATKAFNKDVPFAFGKRIPATIAGGLAGVAVGRASSGQSDSGGWGPGMLGGGAIGALLGGPQAVRAAIEFSKKTGGGMVGATPARLGAKTLESAWRGMKGE